MCNRLSWLPVSFWAHNNVVISYRIFTLSWSSSCSCSNLCIAYIDRVIQANQANKQIRNCFIWKASHDALKSLMIFTMRLHVMQRTVLLSQFCLSVTCVYCDKTKWCTVDILISHERAIALLFWHQQWLAGDAPFPLKFALKMTHSLRKTPTSTDLSL